MKFDGKTCYDTLIKNANYESGEIVFNNNVMKVKDFIKAIDNFSISLLKMGINFGDVVSIYLPTCIQSLIAFYACSRIGAIASFIHPLMTLKKVKETIEETKSKALLFFDVLIEDKKELSEMDVPLIKCSITDWEKHWIIYKLYLLKKDKLKFFSKNHQLYNFIELTNKKTEKIEINSQLNGNNLVSIMHSGGTSGEPKLVTLTNNALNNLSVNLKKMYYRDNKPNEYSLVLLPIFHAYGLGVSIHTCLINKYNLVLTMRFLPKEVVKLIRSYNVTFIAGIPIMFRKMIQQKQFFGNHLSRLKDLWCGGDRLDESLVEHMDEILKKYGSSARLLRGYGLTETCGVCCVNTFQNYKKNSCGKPLPGSKIEIWDEKNNKLSANELGEIVITNNSLMSGYVPIEKKDNGIFVKNNVSWIKTGDIGYLDDEGFLFLMDRKKRCMKINGINIYPSEVENLVSQISCIDESAAVFYHFKDKTYLKLFVTLKDKNYCHDSLKKDISKLCEEHLIKHSIPRLIEVLDIMPRTKNGKIDFKGLELM